MTATNISVDFSNRKGKINPIHGINNAPILGGEPCVNSALFHYMKEALILLFPRLPATFLLIIFMRSSGFQSSR